jgi:hypothetical protein
VNLSFLSLTPRATASVAGSETTRELPAHLYHDSTCVFKSLLGVAVKAAVTRVVVKMSSSALEVLEDGDF